MNKTIKIEVGDFEVLSTGTVIGVKNKPIVFTIEDLVFDLQFIDNKDHIEQKISTQVLSDGKKMILSFENFNNALGTGNIEPFRVGFINDKELSLNYRVYSLVENAGKLLHYTWLLSKKGGQHE